MVERVKIKPKIERVKIFCLEIKARVALTYDPSKKGTVVTVGPEVSEIKWDDRSAQVYVTNHFLTSAGTE